MANSKTLEFLPDYLKTLSNKRFLGATLDQLVSEPRTKKFNGYVGRQFAPVFRPDDKYVIEDSKNRQNYQLEPSIVISGTDNMVEFYTSYTDILQQINFNGGVTDKHSRLFSNQTYSYNGHFDLDKLVNFSQYYWLPNGPDAVDIGFDFVPIEKDFGLDINLKNNGYLVDNSETKNPEIILRRGGTYSFAVNHENSQFYIQTDLGNGISQTNPNQSTREIYGVVNNGASVGTVIFNVPLVDDQDTFKNMPMGFSSDLATTLTYNQIANRLLSDFIQTNGYIDGYAGDLHNKLIVFLDPNNTGGNWTSIAALDENDNPLPAYPSQTINITNRANVYQIKLIQLTNDYLITLVNYHNSQVNTRIQINAGSEYGGSQYYRSGNSLLKYPAITADLDILYYKNSVNSSLAGKIRIIDPDTAEINVTEEILEQVEYTSPNGIKFENGLKVKFDSAVTPVSYANNEYYVEGVGKSINLVAVENLISDWQASTSYSVDDLFIYNGIAYRVVNDFTSGSAFDELGSGQGINYEFYNNIDYITINRGSRDKNLWSRYNRWFHQNTIANTANYNGTSLILNQTYRAVRPVIEFEENLQLFNFGREFIGEVDFYDTTFTDAFGGVDIGGYGFAGATAESYSDGEFILGWTYEITSLGTTTQNEWNDIAGTSGVTYQVGDKFVAATTGLGTNDGIADLIFELQGISLSTGQKIIFGSDTDNETKRTIYQINIVELDGNDTIILTEDKVVEEFQNVEILKGSYSEKFFHYQNNQWNQSQIKSSLQQKPLFEIIDKNGQSLSEWRFSTFVGTAIFSYKIGTGQNDTILGFPLSYRNLGNVGDIEFNNNFEIDQFRYQIDDLLVTENISVGFLLKNITRTQQQKLNIWATAPEKTQQYQLFTEIGNGVTNTYSYNLSVKDLSFGIASVKVFVNNSLVNFDSVLVSTSNNVTAIQLLQTPAVDDKVDILIYSDDVDNAGFYQIPINLENNPLNQDFNVLTLGQVRSHTKEIFSSLENLLGVELGNNNSKDINYSNVPGTIVQHSSPMIYGGLFLTHPKANFIQSIQYAQKEYNKFKNRFLEKAKTINYYDSTKISQHVDQILKDLALAKGADSPYYYSDMIPYGDNRTTYNYTVLDVDIEYYQIESVLNTNQASNRAVLVYKNYVQLIKDKDYEISDSIAAIKLLPSLERNLNDIITIVEYTSTDGNFVPETPTKLGLYPKFEPTIYTDDRYSEPILVIQGHDGSIVPAFNDFRDQFLLELEKRIYNNIKAQYDIQNRSVMWDTIPGKFRNSKFNKIEFDNILSGSFLKWVGNNQLDYVSNIFFDGNDPKTWNYKKSISVLDGSGVPGHWRGIYRYYYDTDRPHSHPWEILGFTEKPDWWDTEYGVAPYTKGNAILWTDLENGYIRQGNRVGIDNRFVRPGLTRVIPVDEYGELLTPDKFLIKNFNGNTTSGAWAIGDMGPVESAWRNSSDYPFSIQIALALTSPADYFGLGIDNNRYEYDSDLDQLLYTDTKDRIRPERIIVHGLTNNNQIQRSASWLNYIVDYLTGQGINGAQEVQRLVNNIDIKLSYKLSGFTDKKLLKVYAEQTSPGSTNDSILVPEENYQLLLHKSTPNRRAVYSAVIIKKTGTGYSVEGYDYHRPYFTIVPSRSNNNFTVVKGVTKSAKIYNDYQLVYLTIPYGYEFQNRQQVVDFLISYQRYLNSLGFRFDQYNEDLRQAQNWNLSCQEFLVWSEQGWGENSVIVLSPAIGKLYLEDSTSVVDEINGIWGGSRLLDQNFVSIRGNDFETVRDSDSFTVETFQDKIIGLADLSLVQYEHVLILDNQTVFNDVIYDPSVGDRQFRLRMVGSKTADWSGRLSAPGFFYSNGNIPDWQSSKDYQKGDLVYFKNRIYSAIDFISAKDTFDFSDWSLNTTATTTPTLFLNFAADAKKFVSIYDVDADYYDTNLELYSHSLIGFRNRSYLDDFSLEPKTQVKFYQGFIKEKGTRNSINALTTAQFNKLGGDIDFFEEWAVRVGSFGAVSNKQITELILQELPQNSNPFGIEILDTGESSSGELFRSYNINQLYSKETEFNGNIFNYRNNRDGVFDQDLISAGFVRPDDIDLTVFNISDLISQSSEIVSDIGLGYTIWTAKDTSGIWNVYKTTGVNDKLISIGYGVDNTAEFTFENRHSLNVGDLIVVKDFDNILDGFYQVLTIESLYSVTVGVGGNRVQYLESAETVISTGIVFRLSSIKLNRLTDVKNKSDWLNGDQVYVDYPNYQSVYEKSNPWQWDLTFNTILSDIEWGNSASINPDETVLAIGVPKSTNALVEHYNITGAPYRFSISPPLSGSAYFGNRVLLTADKMLVGCYGWSGNRGYVAVYNYVGQTFYLDQLIIGDGASTGKFGWSIATGNDQRWLYVGVPGDNRVRTYKRYQCENQVILLSTTAPTATYNLPWTVDPLSAEAIRVYETSSDQWLVPGVDYTISGTNDTITFTTPITSQFTIYKRDFYLYTGQITEPSPVLGDEFGYDIKCSTDGRQLVVGAPGRNSDSGAVYLYDRSVEAFVSTQGQTVFNSQRTLNLSVQQPLFDVRVNGILKEYAVAYVRNDPDTITFSSTLNGGDIVELEPNNWVLFETLASTVNQTGSRFGNVIELCSNNCSLYVSQPEYETLSYKRGLVARFINTSRIFGTVTGDTILTPSACVTSGHSIRINDFEIVFSGVSLTSVIADINNFNIPGITASQADSKLTIIADSVLANRELRLLPGLGTGLVDLELTIFDHNQNLYKPTNEEQNYGNDIGISPDAEKLYIASNNANINYVSNWSDNTTWDITSTTFSDRILKAGTVYEYDLLQDPDEFTAITFTQNLIPQTIQTENNFGKQLAIGNNISLVLSKKTATVGKVDLFVNTTGAKGWTQVRTQNEIIDLNSIESFYLYNKRTNVIVANLDYIDPSRGKVLGPAEQSIDYKTAFDPAVYNTVDGQKSEADYFWGEHQVGKVWWNLDTVRFVDYQQSTREYRLKNWSRLMTGSSIDVYEWVESTVLPSQYRERGFSGIPLYEDDSSYSFTTVVDTQSGLLKIKYYYWVTGKNQSIPNRQINTTTIKSIIENPVNQNIPFVAVLDRKSLALFNCNQFLTYNDIVLKITSRSLSRDLPVHHEWQIIREKNDEIIPEFLVTKLVDSLLGTTLVGNEQRDLPDPTLPDNMKYGIAIRPRQSMFVDKIAASKIFIQFINRELLKNIVVGSKDLSNLYQKDPEPTTGFSLEFDTYEELLDIDLTSLDNGTNILVHSSSQYSNNWAIYTVDNGTLSAIQVQQFNLDDFWSFANWYQEDFDQKTLPNYIVGSFADVAGTPIQEGEFIKINNTGNGTWGVYKKVNDQLQPMALENGTIQISSLIYEPAAAGIGLDILNFDTIRFDYNPTDAFRALIDTLQNDILIDDLKYIFVSSIFAMFEYIFYEQKQPDWLFKTSFISVLHNLRRLDQYPSYVRDNQDYYRSYIEEVKPYKTKIREYLLSYQGNDNANLDVTDFDLPAYYDSEMGQYRSIDPELDTDLLEQQPYSFWNQNKTFYIESVDVISGGSDYFTEPTLIVNGGNGKARLRAVVDAGQIIEVIVVNSGDGFTQQPTITIVTNDNGNSAVLVPRLKNNKVRSIKTSIKFDRIEYDGQIQNWEPNTNYFLNDIFVYQNKFYKAIDNFTSGATFSSTATTTLQSTIGETIAPNFIDLLSFAGFDPLGGYIKINDEIFKYEQIVGSFNRLEIITRSQFSTTAQAHDINDTVIRVNFIEIGVQDLYSAMNRAHYFYQPINGMTPNDVKELFAGVDYPGVRVQGTGEFAGEQVTIYDIEKEGVQQPALQNIDVFYRSTFLDTSLGTNADDINVHGGRFIDTLNSHAPEELVPGRIYDTLEMRIFTEDSGNFVGVRIFHNMNCNTVDSNLNAQPTVETVDALSNVGTSFKVKLFDSEALCRPKQFTFTIINIDDENNITCTDSSYLKLNQKIIFSGTVFGGITAGVDYYIKSIDNSTFTISEDLDSNGIAGETKILNLSSGSMTGTIDFYYPQIMINGELMQYTSYNSGSGEISGLIRGLNGPAKNHDAGSFVTVLDNLKDYRFYYRISSQHTTELAQDLNYYDTEIIVVDSSALITPSSTDNVPGVVFINGEKIIYWTINYSTNTLGQLTRGVHGTGIPDLHQLGSKVSDASEQQVLEDADSSLWNTSGTGIFASLTPQAAFLKSKYSYDPSI